MIETPLNLPSPVSGWEEVRNIPESRQIDAVSCSCGCGKLASLLLKRIDVAILAFPAVLRFLEFIGSLHSLDSSFAIGTDTHTRSRGRVMNSIVEISNLCLKIQKIMAAVQTTVCFLKRHKLDSVIVLEEVVPYLRSISFSWNRHLGLLATRQEKHPDYEV